MNIQTMYCCYFDSFRDITPSLATSDCNVNVNTENVLLSHVSILKY